MRRTVVRPVLAVTVTLLLLLGGLVDRPARPSAATHVADMKTYEIAFETFAARIAEHLHRPLGIAHTIILNTTPGSGHETAFAYTNVAGTRCTVWVNPAGEALQGRDWSMMFAHEVFHCFQLVLNPKLRDSDWIIDGQAEWVGEEIGGPDPMEALGWWRNYLLQPAVPLFGRTYDAIGFYAHLAESGIDPWTVLDAMLHATSDVAAYHAAADGAGEAFLDTWASSFLRDPGRGRAWDTTGLALPPRSVAARPEPVALANEGEKRLTVKPFANGLYALNGPADIVQLDVYGHARVSDPPLDDVVHNMESYCTRSDRCKCPAGTRYVGPTLKQIGSTGGSGENAFLAITGGPEGSLVDLEGVPLSRYCVNFGGPFSASMRAEFSRNGQVWWEYTLDLEGTLNLKVQPALTPRGPLRVSGDFVGLATHHTLWENALHVLYPKMMKPTLTRHRYHLPAPLPFSIPVEGEATKDTLTLKLGTGGHDVAADLNVAHVVYLIYSPLILGGIVTTKFDLPYKGASFILAHALHDETVTFQITGVPGFPTKEIRRSFRQTFTASSGRAAAVYILNVHACNPPCT